MQFGVGKDSPLYLGLSGNIGSAVGSYTNRNHLAGLLEMLLPVAPALYSFSLDCGQHGFARKWKGRISLLPRCEDIPPSFTAPSPCWGLC